jgi:branched-chain amino acid transport system ATP-binding protein
MMMLEVRNVSVSYGKHVALVDLSLSVDVGETVVILGANGAGKTTLMNTIAGLLRPRPGGGIGFKGEDIHSVTPRRIVERGISLVPEGRRIFGELTVEENLRIGAYARRVRSREQQNLDFVMTLFPRLAERRYQTARTMSGGEQQMLAIGRALMAEPELLMLDEPSIGLSPRLTKELFSALAKLRQADRSLMLVEQNAHLSLAIADRAYLLENGSMVREGTADALRADSSVQQAYLGLSE